MIMELKGILESLLFAHGEPLSGDKIAKVLKTGEEEIRQTLRELAAEYEKEGRGLALVDKDGAWQLGTNPAYAAHVEKLVKSEMAEELSKAAVETAAIIAYRGPVTRAEIEHIRGVNSSFTLRNLLVRGLIERMENPKDARSYLYRISFDFLKHLGLRKIEDLPQYEIMRKEASRS